MRNVIVIVFSFEISKCDNFGLEQHFFISKKFLEAAILLNKNWQKVKINLGLPAPLGPMGPFGPIYPFGPIQQIWRLLFVPLLSKTCWQVYSEYTLREFQMRWYDDAMYIIYMLEPGKYFFRSGGICTLMTSPVFHEEFLRSLNWFPDQVLFLDPWFMI